MTVNECVDGDVFYEKHRELLRRKEKGERSSACRSLCQ